ncbi:MAG: GNAT family N-acetyltransferase [Christensenellales bacterium]
MIINFKALENPDVGILDNILYIEQTAFGEGALNEQMLVPLLRYGKVYAAADDDGTAVACAYFLRSMDNTDTAYLFSIAVLPDFRGHNVGTKLLEYALSHIKQYGIFRVKLSVDPANTNAVSVYREQLGFTVAGSAKDEYGAGEDRLVMIKQL